MLHYNTFECVVLTVLVTMNILYIFLNYSNSSVSVSLASSSLCYLPVLRHRAVLMEDSAYFSGKVDNFLHLNCYMRYCCFVRFVWLHSSYSNARLLKAWPLILGWNGYIFISFPRGFRNASWHLKTAGCSATKWRLTFIGFILLLANT
jgi:hypothetical protein